MKIKYRVVKTKNIKIFFLRTFVKIFILQYHLPPLFFFLISTHWLITIINVNVDATWVRKWLYVISSNQIAPLSGNRGRPRLEVCLWFDCVHPAQSPRLQVFTRAHSPPHANPHPHTHTHTYLHIHPHPPLHNIYTPPQSRHTSRIVLV